MVNDLNIHIKRKMMCLLHAAKALGAIIALFFLEFAYTMSIFPFGGQGKKC
jgi:hypothetical protein